MLVTDTCAQTPTHVPDLENSIRDKTVYLACKRALDFSLALTLLVATAPICLVAMLLTKLTSRGPVFYSQVRLGRNGKPYRIYKIRSMYQDCEKVGGAQWSKPGDPRVTPFGRFLRKSHLDELPQLWNVLRGDMALIGPRPERPEFVVQLEQQVPGYSDRLLVQPGVSGLAQVQLPPDTDLESVRRKVAVDRHYVHHCSVWMDLRLMAATGFYLLRVPFPLVNLVFRLPAYEEIAGGVRQAASHQVEMHQAAIAAA